MIAAETHLWKGITDMRLMKVVFHTPAYLRHRNVIFFLSSNSFQNMLKLFCRFLRRNHNSLTMYICFLLLLWITYIIHFLYSTISRDSLGCSFRIYVIIETGNICVRWYMSCDTDTGRVRIAWLPNYSKINTHRIKPYIKKAANWHCIFEYYV